jgi:hypothetical protein
MVLLNLRTEQYYGLDPIGAAIVTRLTRTSLTATADELCREYEVARDVLVSDVERLLDRLLDAGLLLPAGN